MTDDGKPMSEWLNKVTRDQNLWSLADLIVNRIDDARKWFSSRVISFKIALGHYDTVSGKVTLGGYPSLDLMQLHHSVTCATTTAASGSKEWTATGNGWLLVSGSGVNNTTGIRPAVSITPSGGAETYLYGATDDASTAAQPVGMYPFVGGSDTPSGGSTHLRVLRTGDKIKFYDLSYAAGNTTFSLVYIQL